MMFYKDELASLATAQATKTQRVFSVLICLLVGGATIALLPFASEQAPPMPGFVPVYQAALIVVYALTTYLLFSQHRRARSASFLVLGAGSLYVTLIIGAQLLSFPNVFAPYRIVGSGPETTVWLWMLWHVGPPAFTLAYALMEGGGPERSPTKSGAGAGWLTILAVTVGTFLLIILVTRYVHILPKTVDGDDYRLLTTSGVGPAVEGLTVLAVIVLCSTTRLRTVLQLWLAVSLVLLVFDNLITLSAAARGTIGWVAGRLEALMAGALVLAVYLREVDFLYGRAEASAREREARRLELQVARDNLALTLDAADMGAWEVDVASGTSHRTPRYDAIFGHVGKVEVGQVELGQVRGWDVETFLRQVLPEDQTMVRATLSAVSGAERFDFQCRIRRASDDALRWITVTGKADRDGSGDLRRLAGVVRDTTERWETEERLRQAQRMEAVGQLTGGLAHDFNNLLTIIIANLDAITRRPSDARRVERMASNSIQAARRGADLIEKLLSFSRRKVLLLETVNPNRVLKDFQPILRRATGESVTIEFDLDASLNPVRLDSGQFENAILNLVVNARDAMPNGGVLKVRTCAVNLDNPHFSDRQDLASGEYVLVSVTDSGAGMDAETVARAFEPFFTTKDIGKGTGLGLSQVYGFAQQAGGHARVLSALGQGATIEIYLPCSTEIPTSVAAKNALPMRHAVEGEVVLVVEDEPAVLEMAVENLSDLGYRTLKASNAQEALDRLRGSERIDILFSDVVMPGGMNGVQLTVEAKRLCPGLRVLLTSGYTGPALEDHRPPADVPLLSKPYMREDLASKLRVVLSRV